MNILQHFQEQLKEDVEAALFIKDWIGEGAEVVSQQEAESRAHVCRTGNEGKPCERNSNPNWWEKWYRDPIANAIRRELEIKNRLNIRLADESTVHMCSACGCALRIKVWAPPKYIKERTTPQAIEKMPAWCWMRREALA